MALPAETFPSASTTNRYAPPLVNDPVFAGNVVDVEVHDVGT
jgi:hypothetical protein